jgi:hypothetical protein
MDDTNAREEDEAKDLLIRLDILDGLIEPVDPFVQEGTDPTANISS